MTTKRIDIQQIAATMARLPVVPDLGTYFTNHVDRCEACMIGIAALATLPLDMTRDEITRRMYATGVFTTMQASGYSSAYLKGLETGAMLRQHPGVAEGLPYAHLDSLTERIALWAKYPSEVEEFRLGMVDGYAGWLTVMVAAGEWAHQFQTPRAPYTGPQLSPESSADDFLAAAEAHAARGDAAAEDWARSMAALLNAPLEDEDDAS